MSELLLSILIPTVYGREDSFHNLLKKIDQQRIDYNISHNVLQVVSMKDKKEISIGRKRELLYEKADGLFSLQVDDDDELAENAICEIINAIKSNPEISCITYLEYVNMNGIEYKSRHSLEYPDWEGDGNKLLPDGFHFHRTPFMKSVIRTDIARSVPIPDCRFGEDHQWAQSLKGHLKDEIHINKELYRYLHTTTPFDERYGYDK